MPPVSRQRRPLSYEDPSLSDEDVGLLFQVITRAERDPEVERLPFRVLFKAYDEVLAEHGVDADPGYACMRFLLKMGRKNIIGESLFEKFENLLEQMGIVIEFGGDNDNDDDIDEGNETYASSIPSFDGRLRKRVDRDVAPREDTTQTARRRRASFNSMYDVGDDPTQRSLLNRPSSRSSLSRLPMGKPDFPDPTPPPPRAPKATRQSDSPDRTQLMAQFIDMGRRLMSRMDSMNQEKDNNPVEQPASNSLHARSAVDEDRSRRLAEASRSRHRRSLSSKGSDEDAEELSSSSDDKSAIIDRPEVPIEMLYRPSLSDLLRDASTFNMYRQRAINRRILTVWLKKGIQARQSNSNMEVVAANRDRLTLVRQAFETWHNIIQQKRRAAQTERFFKHLDQRAGRARDLYLMTKAFTHWAQVTEDEVAKSSAARRHVLGVKYFNAWREITAVNELKAQRFALRRPFNAWKRRIQQVKQNEETAVVTRDKNLRNDVYWQWFWSFCERRAPQWYDHCLKRRSLLYWLRNFRTNRERYHDIEVKDRRANVTSALQKWAARSKLIATGEQQAASMQRRQLLEESFEEWTIQSRLAPAASRVTDMVDHHVVRAAYTCWVKRAQMLKQAREMDRQRIVRNSWTTWNDLLRRQALTARIDERLKMETMYKWILAERFRLMQRIRDQRITREVFSKFVTNVRSTYSQLLYRAEIHEDRQNEELLRSKLTCWREQLALQRHRDVVAFEFYAPRLADESLVAWRSKLENVNKLEAWARDAKFYFGTTKFLKKWRTATVESAKQRRQDAYAKTRRKIKINLASKALVGWRTKAQEVNGMEQQAVQFSRRKSLNIASELLERWHAKADKQIEDCENADTYYFRQVAYNQLIRLAEVLIEWHRLKEQADTMYHSHILSQANGHLRKLSLRVLQIKSTSETAGALRERNDKRHSRSMFRHWLEKTRLNIEARDSPGPLMSPAKNFEGATQPLFDPWYQSNETPFRLNDFTAVSQAPSPGPLTTPSYLTSPTKRAARARVMAQASTTPATPLQTPFASRLLRAGVGATASKTTSSRRPRNGRGSSQGTSVRFVDEEPPESPTDGRKSANRRI